MTSDRRVFVLAANGEVGPFTVDDLKREIVAGRIHRADQIRTASGKVLGTVGDLVGGVHAHVSGRMPTSNARSERFRASEPRLNAPSSSSAPQSVKRWLPLAAIAVVLLVLGGLWSLHGQTPVSTPSVGDVPEVAPQVRLEAVTNTADALKGIAGLLRITADRAPTADLPLQLQWTGTATEADFQTLPARAVLPAGSTEINLPIVPKAASSERAPAHQLLVRLLPGTGYILGGGITASVTFVSQVRNPSLAFEDFTPRNPYAATVGLGWNGPWLGAGMEFLAGGLNSSSGLGHARIPASNQFRALQRRVSSGTVWLSYVANAPLGVSPADAVPVEYGPWSSLGPFAAASSTEAYATSYLDELQPVDLAKPQGGKNWEPHPGWRDGEAHGLPEIICANYVYRIITVPRATTVPVVIGSDDTLSVWVNGKLLFTHASNREVNTDQDHLALPLKPGRNALLIKIANNGGQSGFMYTDYRPGTVIGVSLFDSSQERLFIGYSLHRQGISAEYAFQADQQFVVLPSAAFRQGTRVVLRLELLTDHTDMNLWIDPPAGPQTPPGGTARIPTLAFDQVRVMVDRGLTWEIGDLRLGSSWDEVVPH